MKILKSKLLWGIVIVLVVIRLLAPPIILKQLNAFLVDFSPLYSAHIDDLGLSIWRGAYQFGGIKVTLKSKPVEFFTAREVDVSVAWRELFRGRIRTDIIGNQAQFIYSDEIIAAIKGAPDKATNDAKNAGEKLFPLNIERIDIRNSSISSVDFFGFSKDLPVQISNIEGRYSNGTPSESNPLSLFSLSGNIFNDSSLKAAGQLNLLKDPSAWLVSAEVKNFTLTSANPFLKSKLPLTFKQGTLDLYTEVKSERGKIEGYVKPFIKNAEIIGDEGDFKGIKHFGIELSVAAVNLIFKNSKNETVATKFLFSYEKGIFDWNASKTISELYKNGYREELTPGVENILSISRN